MREKVRPCLRMMRCKMSSVRVEYENSSALWPFSFLDTRL